MHGQRRSLQLVGALRTVAVVQLQHRDPSIRDQLFTGSILRILGNPGPRNQLDVRDTSGKDQIVHYLGPFIVDVGVDQVDERFVFLGKTDACVMG